MSRFAYDDQVTTEQDEQSCVAALRAAMEGVGASKVESSPDAMDAETKLGSQAFRIWGGILSDDNSLPVQVHGHVEDTGPQRLIYLQVAEHMGIGLMWGMETKYRRHCQDLLRDLKHQLLEQLDSSAPARVDT